MISTWCLRSWNCWMNTRQRGNVLVRRALCTLTFTKPKHLLKTRGLFRISSFWKVHPVCLRFDCLKTKVVSAPTGSKPRQKPNPDLCWARTWTKPGTLGTCYNVLHQQNHQTTLNTWLWSFGSFIHGLDTSSLPGLFLKLTNLRQINKPSGGGNPRKTPGNAPPTPLKFRGFIACQDPDFEVWGLPGLVPSCGSRVLVGLGFLKIWCMLESGPR